MLTLKLHSVGTAHILDFDIETRAAGYADPDWVPDDVTCWAYSWVGSDTVECEVAGPDACFGPYEKQAKFLQRLRDAICSADIVTGHNIVRFDLRVLNGNLIRFDVEPLPQLRVIDTIRLPKTKGLKKGQDNLGVMWGIPLHKLALNHQEWDIAYREPGWPVVKERCASDVEQHKLILAEAERRRLVREQVWKP